MANLAITAANVVPSSTAPIAVVRLAAGVTVTQGQTLYQLSDGTAGLADANGVTPANSFLGFACSAGSPGQPVSYCAADAGFVPGATLTPGFPVYISDTPGAITHAIADLASGSTTLMIGIAVSATVLNLGGTTSLTGTT